MFLLQGQSDTAPDAQIKTENESALEANEGGTYDTRACNECSGLTVLFIFHAAVADDPEVARLLDEQFQLYLTSQTEPSESLARSPTGMLQIIHADNDDLLMFTHSSSGSSPG